MKDKKYIKSFNEYQENLNISDVINSNFLKENFENKYKKYFPINSTLNPILFDKNSKLYDEVLNDIKKNVDIFINIVNIKKHTNIKDIIVRGSSVNYTYSDFSDIDIMVVVDNEDFIYDENIKKIINNYPEIKIKNIECEISIHTDKGMNLSNGVYSITKNDWIKKPILQINDNIDEKFIKTELIRYKKLFRNFFNGFKKGELDVEDGWKLSGDIYSKRLKDLKDNGNYNRIFKYLERDGIFKYLFSLIRPI